MTFEPFQRYPKSAYGEIQPRLKGIRRTPPNTRGWGPGWPDCQKDKIVRVDVAAVRVRVRSEIADLIGFLFAATEALGYDIRLSLKQSEAYGIPIPPDSGPGCGGTWGFACRAIKRSDPPQPSWHSWGLAVDINAPCNPMTRLFSAGGKFSSNMPPKMVDLWESAGFFWGGRYPTYSDAMHFEYMFRPADVAMDMDNARAAFKRLSPVPIPPPEDEVTPEQVKALQTMLNTLGANLEVDGVYGPVTDAAVKAAGAADFKTRLTKAEADVDELTARITTAAELAPRVVEEASRVLRVLDPL